MAQDNIPDLLKDTVVGNEILDLIQQKKMSNSDAALMLAEMFTNRRPNILENEFASITGANQLQESVGSSKSIDDIINQSNLIEAIAPSDATNVEAKGRPIRQMLPGRTEVDTLIDALYPPTEDEKMLRLKQILKDLAKQKPIDT